MDRIWWTQIHSARRFVSRIEEALLQEKSAFLYLPDSMPWYQTMVEQIQDEVQQQDPKRRFETIESPEGGIGQFLMETYCKAEKREQYRPSKGKKQATFLARSNDIVMNERYIWVRNVKREAVAGWQDFLEEYLAALPHGMAPAVFIVEVRDADDISRKIKGVQDINYVKDVTEYDIYTFCTICAADISCCVKLKPYLAALVSTISEKDPELCAACLDHWKDMLRDPGRVLERVVNEEAHCDGSPYDCRMTRADIDTGIWETQIKILFPALERFRAGFIEKYKSGIQKNCPFESEYNTYAEPEDVELGPLYYMVKNGKLSVTDSDREQLGLFKHARDKLAHLSCVEYADVEKILMVC